MRLGAPFTQNDIVDDVWLRAVCAGTPYYAFSLGKLPVFKGVAAGVAPKLLW